MCLVLQALQCSSASGDVGVLAGGEFGAAFWWRRRWGAALRQGHGHGQGADRRPTLPVLGRAGSAVLADIQLRQAAPKPRSAPSLIGYGYAPQPRGATAAEGRTLREVSSRGLTTSGPLARECTCMMAPAWGNKHQ